MSVLRDAINALDPAPDQKKEITLAVSLLYELAEQKKEIQESFLKNQLRTAGTPENPSIPITNTLGWYTDTRAYTQKNAGALVDIVTGAVKDFVNGGSDNIINGVGKLLTGGLTAILGSGSGIEKSMYVYYIVVEGLSIVRFDVCAWQRRVEVTGFTGLIENAMTMTAVKSSVNVDKITFNTFLQAYKVQLEEMKFTKTELKEYVTESKEVFELLRDPSSPPNNSTADFAALIHPPSTFTFV